MNAQQVDESCVDPMLIGCLDGHVTPFGPGVRCGTRGRGVNHLCPCMRAICSDVIGAWAIIIVIPLAVAAGIVGAMSHSRSTTWLILVAAMVLVGSVTWAATRGGPISQCMWWPPLTRISCPVMNAEPSLRRNTTVPTTSSATIRRFRDRRSITCSSRHGAAWSIDSSGM